MQEGHHIAAEQRATRLETEKKAEEISQKKKDVEAENHVQRLREGKTGMVFEGALASQKLPFLHDIAWTLRLAELGTCEVLITQINNHFNSDENGSLKEDDCYIGLFSRCAQKWKALDGPPIVAMVDNWQDRVGLCEHTNIPQAGLSLPPQASNKTYLPHFQVPQSMGPWSVQPHLQVPYPAHCPHQGVPLQHLWTHMQSDSEWSFSFH